MSTQQLLGHLAGDIGQAKSASLVAEGQALVVESQQVQNRRVQVANVHAVLGGMVAEVVGLAVRVAALDAAAGEPDGERVLVMIASRIGAGSSLHHRRTAKLAAPD